MTIKLEAKKKSTVISVTGHRPNKLYGYDVADWRYTKLKNDLRVLLVHNHCTEAITGMAMGVDMIFAIAVLELQKEGYDIKLHCAIPCQNHDAMWSDETKDLYHRILKRADKVVLVSDIPYQPWVMQKRNEYMVNLADMVIAVWDGSKGGTSNCVKYAKKVGKPLMVVNP